MNKAEELIEIILFAAIVGVIYSAGAIIFHIFV